MELFFQAAAAILLAVVLSLALGSVGKGTGILLTIAVSVMVLILGITYLKPVMDFLHQLETLGNLNSGMTGILFKVVGIGLLSEIVGMVCTDSGNSSMGKALNMLATAIILWLSIPLFNGLLDLIQNILGEL